MPSINVTYKEKNLNISYKVERKYGLVNYIINGKNGAVFYFRKYDDGEFHLAYGNMKDELARVIIAALKEIHGY